MRPKYKVCQNPACGKPLTTHQQKYFHKFCSPDCRKLITQGEYRKLNPRPLLPTPTTGAISELIASTDLMLKGYSVFRALSASCACDLAVLSGRRLCRVEVKTGHKMGSGKVSWPKCDSNNYDVLAVVLPAEHVVIYYPPVEDFFAS